MAEPNVGASVHGPQYEEFNQPHAQTVSIGERYRPAHDALLSFGEGPYMTLLDLLAGQIMSGLVVNKSGGTSEDYYADAAYRHAAAMLRVRKRYITEIPNA